MNIPGFGLIILKLQSKIREMTFVYMNFISLFLFAVTFLSRMAQIVIIKIAKKIALQKAGERMGMTNKQFQGFIRLALELIDKALNNTPDNEDLQKLKDIFQSMLEDD